MEHGASIRTETRPAGGRAAGLWRRLAAAGMLLAGVMTASPPAAAGQKVILGQPTAVTIGHAPLIFARSLGFFAEEGIDLEIVEFEGAAILMPQVAAKRVTIGYPNPDILILARQPGRDRMPVRFFYNSARSSIWEVVVPENGPVTAIGQLKGKKIGIGSMATGNIPLLKAMLKEAGIRVDTDVELVPVGVGAPAFRAFSSGQVDALNLFDVQHAMLENTGVAIRRLAMPEKYADLMSNGFVAHEDTIRDQGPLLAAFGRAISKGVVACEAAPMACIETYWAAYPNQKPAEGSEEEKRRRGLRLMHARFSKLVSFRGERRFGAFNEAVWRDYVDALYAGGQLATPGIDVSSLYTNDLVDAFNRFDAAAVAARAKAGQ